MSDASSVVVVGGTRAIGFEVARHYAAAGQPVVLSGRDPGRVRTAAAALPGDVRGVVMDLADPHRIAAALADVGPGASPRPRRHRP